MIHYNGKTIIIYLPVSDLLKKETYLPNYLRRGHVASQEAKWTGIIHGSTQKCCRGSCTLAVDHVSINSRFFELDGLFEFD